MGIPPLDPPARRSRFLSAGAMGPLGTEADRLRFATYLYVAYTAHNVLRHRPSTDVGTLLKQTLLEVTTSAARFNLDEEDVTQNE